MLVELQPITEDNQIHNVISRRSELAKPDNTIRNSVIGSVASALIVAAVLYFVPSFWAAAKWSFSLAWSGFIYTVPMPVWSLLILACLIVPAIFRFLAVLRKDPGPTWRDYTRDTFRGMVWRWRFSSSVGGCHNVWCYCPDDDTALVYSEQER